ncbi:hypothetical protein GCM10018790_15610 [Kitasatospora xanthocidica]|nr:hypothetical protein GCM10018790_15610 [Kitasatospora xanthocidica]
MGEPGHARGAIEQPSPIVAGACGVGNALCGDGHPLVGSRPAAARRDLPSHRPPAAGRHKGGRPQVSEFRGRGGLSGAARLASADARRITRDAIRAAGGMR